MTDTVHSVRLCNSIFVNEAYFCAYIMVRISGMSLFSELHLHIELQLIFFYKHPKQLTLFVEAGS